jgi:hypothetical protein
MRVCVCVCMCLQNSGIFNPVIKVFTQNASVPQRVKRNSNDSYKLKRFGSYNEGLSCRRILMVNPTKICLLFRDICQAIV